MRVSRKVLTAPWLPAELGQNVLNAWGAGGLGQIVLAGFASQPFHGRPWNLFGADGVWLARRQSSADGPGTDSPCALGLG